LRHLPGRAGELQHEWDHDLGKAEELRIENTCGPCGRFRANSAARLLEPVDEEGYVPAPSDFKGGIMGRLLNRREGSRESGQCG